MRVEVDRNACCGSGNCVMTVPEVFDQDDRQGLVVLLRPRPAAPAHDLVREAALLCPAGAITVIESGDLAEPAATASTKDSAANMASPDA
jgi:ferredoxin